MLTHMGRRCLVMLFMLAALLGFAGLPSVFQPAGADALVSLQGCNPAGSGGGVTCNLQLMTTVDGGGAWKVTVADTGATVSACDGSASNATCTASGNTATFTCPVGGCPSNSKYTITVEGATSPQSVYFAMVSLGSYASGAGVGAGVYAAPASYTAAPGYTTAGPTATYTTAPAYTTTPTYVAQPIAALWAGGQCVNGSYPTRYGCTAPFTGPLTYPSYGYYGYGLGCYNSYWSCGGTGYTPYYLGNCGGFYLIYGCASLYNYGMFNTCGSFFYSCGNTCGGSFYYRCGTFNTCTNFIWGYCNNGIGFCGGLVSSNCSLTSCSVLNACMSCSSFTGSGCAPNTSGKNICNYNSFFVYSC